ncbi:LSM domain-containing protein [Phytophthora infestans]|uniref:LSM domain-containing protein n=1 Tax=Phytophthora infestans TaxID=4787 RepID=A0A833TP50_PHYIN|nr:LSM domain-containing protein [Phytophthora infestans]KAF4130158.1 LSM domain-containing protein [Phytophthora infestans]
MKQAAPPAAAELAKPKRKRRKPRSLLLLLKSFVGLRVRIDLKNDSVLEGVVQEVVQDMDFTLLDACETKPNGTTLMLDEVFVMGKTVLYVHIPDRINITQHLQQYTRMIRQSATMYTRAKRTASSRPGQ